MDGSERFWALVLRLRGLLSLVWSGVVVRKKSEKTEGVEETEAESAPVRRRLRHGTCKRFLQDEVSLILREAVEKLREKILKGDAAALKTLWQMSGLDKEKPKPRKRSDAIARRILKRIQEREAEAAQMATQREEGERRSLLHGRAQERVQTAERFNAVERLKAVSRLKTSGRLKAHEVAPSKSLDVEKLYREAEALLAREEAKRRG